MPTPVTTKPASIASRLKSFGAVHAALNTQSTEAVTELGHRQAATLAGGRTGTGEPALLAVESGDYQRVFAHLAGELEGAKDQMISANSAHLGQLARIVELKARRAGLTGALSGRFLKVRNTFETLYGSHQGFPVLAVSGRTPRSPTGLVAQVRETAAFLAEPKVELPPLDVDGIAVDPPTTAVQLGAGADELDGVLVELNEAQKQADVTRQAKNDAISAYDRKFLRVARMAESLFHFAGMHELAKRVRPSTRRPGRRLADGGSEPEPGDSVARQAPAETSGEPEADAPSVEPGESFIQSGPGDDIEILHPAELSDVVRHHGVLMGDSGRGDQEVVRPDHLSTGTQVSPQT